MTALRGRARARFLTPSLLLIGLGLALRGLFVASSQRVPLLLVLGWRFHFLLAGLGLALVLLVWATVRELRALCAGEQRASVPELLRWSFVVGVSGWLLFLLFVQPFQRIWFDMASGLAGGAWALGLLVRDVARRHERSLRAVDLASFSLCAMALGIELGLRAAAGLRPSALNARVGAAPGELIRRFRCEPGLVRFGFGCNSQGFYDTEFHQKSPGEGKALIVAIGDSFNVGMVPHAWHFTTICEELLGATVLNMGVPGIGPPEYLSLLVEEALPLDPDMVLIGVFVGNDLNVADVLEGLPDATLRAWFQRDQVLLFVLPERLYRVRKERIRSERRAGGERVALRPMDREQAAQAFPWVSDPSLEEPTYSQETFLRIEATRALDVCTGVPPSFDVFCRSMLAAQRAAGDVPLRVLLIPEEFQVEDALWEAIQKLAGRELERAAPQRLLTAWLAEQGIPCLDLLPVLRAVPPGPDGRRHLYHSLDTHFNARGNQVTAHALAEFLR